MPGRRSLEVRLALWYSALLLAGLLAVGGALWVGVGYSMTAAVDEILSARADALAQYIDAEYEQGFLAPDSGIDQGEVKGRISEVDLGGGWLVVGAVRIRLKPDTVLESGPAVGQDVEVEVSRLRGEWTADEVALAERLESQVREDAAEFIAASPDSRHTQIRSADGDPFVVWRSHPDDLGWLDGPGTGRIARVVPGPGADYRVVQDDIALAGVGYRIQMASSLAAMTATRRRLVGWLAWATPLGLLLGLLGGYVISRQALRPVQDVVDVAQTMTVERLSERLDVPPTGDVVELLGKTFNSMLDRLEVAVKRLEEFTGDASHELRSPVTVIRTTAELALRQDRTAEEYRADMQEVQAEAARLTTLIEDLLTLARSGAGGDRAPKERLNLGELVSDIGRQQSRLHPERRIDIAVDEGAGFIEGNESLVRRLVVILLDNAVRHTPDDASVAVSVRSESGGHVLSVTDNGTGIPEEDLPRVFDRFYRGDSSRNRTNGGFGLGLSIARWVAETHSAAITVRSRVGQGTEFTVSFPDSPA